MHRISGSAFILAKCPALHPSASRQTLASSGDTCARLKGEKTCKAQCPPPPRCLRPQHRVKLIGWRMGTAITGPAFAMRWLFRYVQGANCVMMNNSS